MAASTELRALWRSALDAVDPEPLVARWLSSRRLDGRRRGLFACGKAAAAMARGARLLSFDAILVVAPAGTEVAGIAAGVVHFASHPEPDRSSLAAARAALAFFRTFGARDSILALVSGGASSLLSLPRTGVTLSEKRARIRRAMRDGWPIERLNRLRISLSGVKGGRLAEATDATVTTLVLSDMPGADYRLVGSGPTISPAKPRDRAVLLADNRTGVTCAAARARRTAGRVRILRDPIAGEARAAGAAFARALGVFARGGGGFLLAGGETTVAIRGRAGRGGRNQELALAAAIEIAGDERLSILSAGSDGVDGNSNAAGAFVDGSTIARGRNSGIDAEECLDRHDAGRYFERVGGALGGVPTGTNVADWVFGRATASRGRR